MAYELTCLNCGFMTYSYEDMIKHLAHWHNEGYKKEDWCRTKTVKIREL
jgi:hypothetical protein